MRVMFSLAMSAFLTAGAVQASVAAELSQETDIDRGRLNIMLATKIRKHCGMINLRLLKTYAYGNALKDLAAERGYSKAEMDAYLDDKDEKKRLRGLRNAYFEEHDASKNDPESLCALGHSEIRKKSQIGLLLKAK